jgi:mitochondrial fission protein ELM1
MSEAAEPVWVLADPRAGTAAQAIGIAERLGRPFRAVPLEWGPLARLPLGWGTLLGLAPASRGAFRPPWPRLVVSAGRRSAPVALWLRRRGARVVHCMRAPGSAGFDLQVVGAHDGMGPAPNRIEILGAAHRVTPAALAAAHGRFAALGGLPSPRVGLMLGGPVRGEGLDPAIAVALGRRVAGFAGSVMATASRRTGAAATAALAEALAPVPHRLHGWGSAGENPYLGILAWADVMVVSGDSVSMLSEALVTAAPIFIAPLGDEGPRHRALHASLQAAGQARPIDDAPAPFARQPRDEVARIVAAIQERGLLTHE